MTISTPAAINRYLTAQATRDWNAMIKLFTDDAVVIDEGQLRRGKDEIRAWRENVASAFDYTTEVAGVEPQGDGQYVAHVHLEGNFPGGTADLSYRFEIDDDRIRRLEISA